MRYFILLAWLGFISFTTANADQDWSSFGGDYRNQFFSPLKQIDTHNVQHLERAWQFKSGVI
ncbi:MAG: hypothetical protein ORN21_01945, partial [Methylophilaceae bacterium]|nr:hypothetical protein [Methylophilaceae bacterium]